MNLEKQLDNSIDPRLERLVTASEQHGQNIAALLEGMRDQNHHIDVLTEQVGRLTESRAEFRTDMSELKTTTRRQAETAERQERNVERLAGLVMRLLERG